MSVGTLLYQLTFTGHNSLRSPLVDRQYPACPQDQLNHFGNEGDHRERPDNEYQREWQKLGLINSQVPSIQAKCRSYSRCDDNLGCHEEER